MNRFSAADYARYLALLASMIISYYTQQHLAVTHGIPEYPSYAAPVAIDLYLIWAVRTRRDVTLAVLVAVAANVAGVLTSMPLDDVDTWVAAALHAVFPTTLWRMHRPAPTDTQSDPWADFDASAATETVTDSDSDELVTPPSADDVRAVIAALGSTRGRPVTGAMLAEHYGVSERTGRRYLNMAA